MAWFNTDWGNRKEITLHSGDVDATLSDYPLYVQIIGDSDLASDAQNDGDDILFTQSDGTTQLNHEIEAFDGGSGDLDAHVRIPTLSSVSDTTIYIYYNNPGASNQENVTGVWSSDYAAVYHMNESAGAGTLNDSTSNDNDGSPTGDADGGATSQIDGAWDFGGGRVDLPGGAEITSSEATMSCWVELDEDIDTQSHAHAVGGRGLASAGSGICFEFFDAGGSGGDIFFDVYDSQDRFNASFGQEWATDTPYHLVGVVDSTDGFSVWVDGSESEGDGYGSFGNIDWQGDGNAIGAQDNGSRDLDGQIDEVRFLTVPRSDGWITTEYSNQNNPGAFMTVGAEESALTTRAVSEAITSFDSAVRGRAAQLEQVIVDLTKVRRAQETQTVTDATALDVTIVVLTQVLAETAAVIDAVASNGVFPRALSEALDVVDVTERTATLFRSFSETVPTVDATNLSATFLRDFTEVASVIDAVATTGTFPRSFTEAVTGVDTATTFTTFVRSFTEGVRTFDVRNLSATLTRALTESVPTFDAVNRSTTFLRDFSESVTVADATAAVKKALASFSETVRPADAVATAVEFSRPFAERVVVVDDSVFNGTFSRTFAETAVLVDAASARAFAAALSLSETVRVEDTAVLSVDATRALAETAQVIDTVFPNAADIVALSESVAVFDRLSSIDFPAHAIAAKEHLARFARLLDVARTRKRNRDR